MFFSSVVTCLLGFSLRMGHGFLDALSCAIRPSNNYQNTRTSFFHAETYSDGELGTFLMTNEIDNAR